MMLPHGKRRARTEEDRALRRAALVACARAAIADRPYDAITMADVAEAAGVSKGAAYLYFSTKEELFLALLQEDLGLWFDEIEAGMARLRGEPKRAAARLVGRSLARAPVLLKLLELLHGRLEPNAPAEALRAFKVFLRDGLGRIGRAVEAAIDARPGFGATWFLRAHALAIGLGPMSRPPAAVEDILAADASLAFMRIDFETAMAATLEDLARGMTA
ncbi:MAG: TetR/AcrR family transcriptional regulator [Alphaproteobacteria bacterium]|nr:TetR/AcrR family transcriptional regulator [Alphaproteobacteria bacterium]